MKFVGAFFLIVLAVCIGLVSAFAGSLALVTGSPTTGNWAVYYLLAFIVPLGLLALTVFILIHMFR